MRSVVGVWNQSPEASPYLMLILLPPLPILVESLAQPVAMGAVKEEERLREVAGGKK